MSSSVAIAFFIESPLSLSRRTSADDSHSLAAFFMNHYQQPLKSRLADRDPTILVTPTVRESNAERITEDG
jgi:hypothetical protein